jgi:uncharacterized protein YbcV (DUF1398 family)
MIKKSIIVNPELLPEIIKNNECDLYTVWNVAKLIDLNGNGIIEIKEIINICNKLFNLKSKYVYEKINSGINLYWTKPHGQIRNRKICLFSITKIVTRLKPNVTRSKPIAIPVTHLEGLNTKSIKEIYISIFAARYENDSPISISSLEKFLGVSESSVRNALKNCPHIKTKKNYEILSYDTKKENLAKKIIADNHPYNLRIIKKEDGFVLIKQIPNSYHLFGLDRLPFKYRPKCLRLLDKNILANLSKKKYDTKNGCLTSDNNETMSSYI